MIRAAVFSIALLAASLALAGETPKKATRKKVVVASSDTRVTTVRGALTLDRAIALALRQNPDLLRALKEIERTRGQVIEVRAQALPRVGVNATYFQQDKYLLERSGGGGSSSGGSALQFTDESGNTVDLGDSFGGSGGGSSSSFGSFGGDKSWRVAIEARQLLYSGGQVGAALKIARFTEDQAYYLLRDTVDRVISIVRTQFYRVLLNRKLITVSEESIRLLQDQLKTQKDRLEAGVVPRFTMLQAEVALANARPDLIRARNNYHVAQLELSRTLGLEASKSPTGKPTFDVAGELRAVDRPVALQTALATARARRPFLKAQQQNILTEEQQITVAKAGLKPRLEANAGWEFRNSRRTDDLSKEVNGWYYGITGDWAIFDGFETKGRVIQARARLASAQITYADSVLQVELEVQQAHARLHEARELIVSQEKVVEVADEALRLARERFNAGVGVQLDVLNAEVALTRARVTQQQALYDYNVALAEFDRATGTDTVYDDTFVDPRATEAKVRLRKGTAGLRDETLGDK
jgi:outer membrane protein